MAIGFIGLSQFLNEVLSLNAQESGYVGRQVSQLSSMKS